MAVSYEWVVEMLDADGAMLDAEYMGAGISYGDAVLAGYFRVDEGRCVAGEVVLRRFVWTHDDGVLDETYLKAPFADGPEKYRRQWLDWSAWMREEVDEEEEASAVLRSVL